MRSTWIYAAMSAGLIAAGVVAIARGDAACTHGRHAPEPAAKPLGGALLLGASSALVVSPCCTPVIAAIAGVTIAGTRPLDGVLLIVAYACGHAVPLLLAGALGRPISAFVARGFDRLPRELVRPIAVGPLHVRSTISATLMLALGAYYGALA